MDVQATYYRRRAIVARQSAAGAIDPSVRAAFAEVANHWLALAEQVVTAGDIFLDKSDNEEYLYHGRTAFAVANLRDCLHAFRASAPAKSEEPT